MSDVKAVDLFAEQFSKLKSEIAKVIIGQNDVVEQTLISLFVVEIAC